MRIVRHVSGDIARLLEFLRPRVAAKNADIAALERLARSVLDCNHDGNVDLDQVYNFWDWCVTPICFGSGWLDARWLQQNPA